MNLKVPYGESNFQKVITGGFVYIDKTHYIPQLEATGSHLFLLRPRRFGKSLFLSMLEYYYDIAYKNEFSTLFGQLAIGQSPTPACNSYQVLFMDFSGIDTDGGHEAIFQRFSSKLEMHLQTFLRRYAYPDSYQIALKDKGSPADKMQQFVELLGEQKFLLLRNDASLTITLQP
ncbi:AAA family ATPase [Thiofilum flexile]|uniref:AAA family ATPase n=1 Tax=Thiofilum flexile TaxID=125627 RepID=UPI0003A9BA6F|nr:AAA family ATPase [Thiofilum flexile]